MPKIFIDYSQQNWNKCVMGDTEQQHTFEIAKVLQEKLMKDGRFWPRLAKYITYGSEKDRLYAVVKESNDFCADIHFSIHTDGGYNGHGCSVFYGNHKDLAQKIYNRISKLTPWSDMGISQRMGLYVIGHTTGKAILCEISFHDQIKEAKWIHENIRKIADELYIGLLNYYGLKYPS